MQITWDDPQYNQNDPQVVYSTPPAPERPDDPPSGYRWGANGSLEPIPGGPADESGAGGGTPTEAERRYGSYYNRALGANRDFAGYADVGAPSTAEQVNREYLPDFIGNRLLNANRQTINNIEAEFVAAALRADSGAAVPEQEQQRYSQMYFPRAGDSPQVIRQKARARERVIQGLRVGAGRSLEQMGQEVDTLLQNDLRNFEANGYPGPPLQDDYQGASGAPQEGEDAFAYYQRLIDAGHTPEEAQRAATAYQDALNNAAPAGTPPEALIFGGLPERSDPNQGPAYSQQNVMEGASGVPFAPQAGALIREVTGQELSNQDIGSLNFLDAAALNVPSYVTGQGERMRALGARAPTEATTGSIAGYIAGGGALSTAGRGIARGVGADALLGGGGAGTVGRAAALGGTEGAIVGQTTRQDPLTGAAVGTVAGPAGVGVGRLVGKAGSLAGDIYRGARGTGVVEPVQGQGRRLVMQALRDDRISLNEARALMTGRNAQGTPAMLADLGVNARELAGAIAREGGEANTIVRGAVINRQEGASGRAQDFIERDLGPVRDRFEESARLMDEGRATAGPLYERAYAEARDVYSPDMEALLKRPSGRAALARARRIAAEEGRDPTTLGFDLNAQGEVVLVRNPSLQTLDYVKRGMDDILESYRDSTTGRLNLNTEGRAIEGTRRDFVRMLDERTTNPATGESLYRQAREAWADPVSSRDAMERGYRALNMSADEIRNVTKGMTPAQTEHYRLGLRSALSEAVDRRVTGADQSRNIFGTPRRRKAIAEALGGDADLNRFVASLRNESAATRTYQSIEAGSATGDRRAATERVRAAMQGRDIDTFDAALAGGRQGGFTGAGSAVLERFRNVGRGVNPQSVDAARTEAAQLLTETNPTTLGELLMATGREEAERRARAIAAIRNQRALDSSIAGISTIGALGFFGQ